MVTQIAVASISAIFGAIVGAIVTYTLDRIGGRQKKDGGQKVAPLQGDPLIKLKDYPVREGDGGSIELDLGLLKAVCHKVIRDKNPHAAADLLYLAEQNSDAVKHSSEAVNLVQRVEKKFRQQLRHVDAVKDQRKNLLEPLINVTHGLGQMFRGLPIEFVLHDIRDPLHSIRAIENRITGREVDSPLTNLALQYLVGEARAIAPRIDAAYRTPGPDGRPLKSTTIPIQDRVFGVISFLCINIDIDKFNSGSADLSSLLKTLTDTPGGLRNEIFKSGTTAQILKPIT